MKRLAAILTGTAIATAAAAPAFAQDVVITETMPAPAMIQLVPAAEIDFNTAVQVDGDPLIGEHLYSYEQQPLGEITSVWMVDGVKTAQVTPSNILNVDADALYVAVDPAYTGDLKLDIPIVELRNALVDEVGAGDARGSDS